MAEARLKSGMFVSMALRRGNNEGKFGAVLHRGDPDAGGILVVLRGREGMMVLSQVRDAGGEAAWMRGTGLAPVEQEAADAYIERQRRYDPDLWVVEFDAHDFVPPFEAKLV
jgi:hypothetical protein